VTARGLVLLVVAMLGLAGCGVLDDEGPALPRKPDPSVYGPPAAVPGERAPIDPPALAAPRGAVARALDAGTIGVVGITGAVGVKPDALEVASDSRLESLTWTRWDGSGAAGRGELRSLVCRPTCASGRIERIPARVTLSGVKTCGDRRYFERGEVLIDPRRSPSGEQPATYVRAPC
jgi:hypothetical protein